MSESDKEAFISDYFLKSNIVFNPTDVDINGLYDLVKNGKDCGEYNIVSARYVGMYYKYTCNFDKALEILIDAYEGGNLDAALNIGSIYFHNKKFYSTAIEWFMKGSEHGCSISMTMLGSCYFNGTGVPKDMNKAFEWYVKSADLKFPIGMYNLAACYINGFGTERDEKKAVYWFTEAAKYGDIRSMNALAECYKYGCGVEKDDIESKKWLLRAKDKTYIPEIVDTTPKAHNLDLSKTFDVFRNRASDGDLESEYNMAICYLNGEGVKKNYNKAIDILIASGGKGYKPSTIQLRKLFPDMKVLEAYINLMDTVDKQKKINKIERKIVDELADKAEPSVKHVINSYRENMNHIIACEEILIDW